MKKTAKQIADTVLRKQAAQGYRMADRLAIRAAAGGMPINSEHIAKRIFQYKRYVELQPLLKAIRGVADKFQRLAERGKRINTGDKWYRAIYGDDKKVKGYLLGHGQRMRTVYTTKMNPKGTKI